MRRLLHSLSLGYKSMGLMGAVPYIALDLVYPLMLNSVWEGKGELENFLCSLSYYGMLLVPLFSIWFLLIPCRMWVEGDGNELLYATSSRMRLGSCLLLLLPWLCNLALIYLILSPLDVRVIWAMIDVLSVCVCFVALSYATQFVTGSLVVALLIAIVIWLASVMNVQKQPEPFLFACNAPILLADLKRVLPPRAIFAALMLILGLTRNRFYRQYR